MECPNTEYKISMCYMFTEINKHVESMMKNYETIKLTICI